MPPHKYYCDYCDKQFYDTPASRKRHLKGISHQRAKKQWFDSFKGSYALSSLFGPPYLHYSPILPRQLVHFINRLFVIGSCSNCLAPFLFAYFDTTIDHRPGVILKALSHKCKFALGLRLIHSSCI
jgi:hypothetical protein